MKKHTKKLKAFTIAELLVVLVISAIVISISMLTLNLIQKQLKTISSNYAQQTETRILERTLWQDFNRHRLFFNNKQQRLECISAKDTVTYIFSANHTIRNTDTLKIPIYKTTVYLEGIVTITNQLDAIELQLSTKQTHKKIFIATTKDGAFYMNNDGI